MPPYSTLSVRPVYGNPNAWDIVDDAGRWYGHAVQRNDGRYWLDAPGMDSRPYVTVDRAVDAVVEFNLHVNGVTSNLYAA